MITTQSANHIRVSDASKILGVSTKTLRRWNSSGRLVPERSEGGHRYYTYEQLRNFNSGTANSKQKAINLEPDGNRSILLPSNEPNFKQETLNSKPVRNLGHKNWKLFGIPALGFSILILGVIIVTTVTITIFSFKDRIFKADKNEESSVLSATTATTDNSPAITKAYTFGANVPVIFSESVTFTKDVNLPNMVSSIIPGTGTDVEDGQNPTISNTGVLSLNKSTGDLSLTAGLGIDITSPSEREVTITNIDLGSIQNIFKNVVVDNQPTIRATGNSDTLTFVGGNGITITSDSSAKKIIFTADPDALNVTGWTKSGDSITNTTPADFVGIGTTTSRYNLEIAGTKNTTGNVTFGGLNVGGATTLNGALTVGGNTTIGDSSSDTLIFNGRLATGTGFYPATDLGASLGTPGLRFNNVYVANFNSNSGLTTAGQATFTYSPTDTTFAQASVIAVDPGVALSNAWLLGLGVGNNQRAGIDAEGDITLGYNGASSAPSSSNPLSIYNHGSSLVATVDTSGNLTASGNLNISGLSSDIAGTLNLSRNILTSSGALSITPNAGSNLNVNVSNGGQFTVNNSQLTVNSTTGYTGIGTATASAQLDVAAINGTDAIVLSNNGVKALGVSTGTNSVALNITSTDPTNKLTNGTFESDLAGWTGSQTYSLNDEFTDAGPSTLATSTPVTLQSGGITNPMPSLGNWWLAGGVSPSNAIAAYQPVGAANYDASKINLANPGTYNATDGVAPDWDSVNGWKSNGTKWLHTGVTNSVAGTWSIIVKLSNSAASSGAMGVSNGVGQYMFIRNAVYGTYTLYIGSGAVGGTGNVLSGVLAIAGTNGYLNGTNIGSRGGGTVFTQDIHIFGTSNASDTSSYLGALNIQSAAIYNTPITAAQVLAVTNAMNGINSSAFSTVPVATTATSTDYAVQADATLTSGSNAGVALNLDSTNNPQNFIIAYHDGANIHLDKYVAGVPSSLINITATYMPSATIKVVKNGFNYSLYYNGVQKGTTQVITDAGIVNNTNHGVFSTYAGNSFSNFLVQSQVTNPTPVVGTEMLTDGGLENWNSSTDLTSWSEYHDSVSSVNQETASVHGGTNAARLDIGTNGNAFIQQGAGIATNNWYQVSVWAKSVPSGSGLTNIGNTTLTDTYAQYIPTIRSTPTNITFQRTGNSSDKLIYIDDASVKPLTLSSLFSTVTVAANVDHTVQADVTVTTGTQAGVVLNMDSTSSPTKFVIGYTNGTQACLDKNVSGTYTAVIACTNINYSAGATLKVIQNGTSYSLFYNGTQVGTTQTISNVPVSNIQGVFSTYANNSFVNFSVKGGINGTLATDGVNIRTVTDTASLLSVSSNKLNFNGGANANMIYSNLARATGKMILSEVTSASIHGGFQLPTSNQDFYGAGGGILQLRDPAWLTVGAWSAGVSYKTATIMRATGLYYYIKGGTEYPNWTLVYVGSIGSGTLTPRFTNGGNSTAYTSDFIKIPTSTWLPTPLAYDTFTATGSATTETVGPDGQTTPALSWTGGTKSGGKMSIIPALGSELVINGGFDSDTSWIKGSGWTISGGVANYSNLNGNLTQTLPLSVGTWYLTSVSKVSGLSGEPEVFTGGSYLGSLSNGVTKTAVGRASSTDIIIASYTWSNAGSIDNVSVKPIALSSLFSTVPSSDADVIADTNVTLTAGTQAGLVLNLDSTSSPANFVIAYHDGTSIFLDKNVGGTYTNLIKTAVTYVPGATLRVITYHSDANTLKVRVYYNNALVGSEQTITDASIINNTNHGLFSTYAGNTFDNFTLWPRGTGNEYAQLTPEPLTVTRDTTIKYAGSTGSAKLVAGSTDGDFTEMVNVGDTNSYTLTAFVYMNSSPVGAGDVGLYYGSGVINTIYSPIGGDGWYKLTGTLTGIASNQPVGVRVKAGKTVYVDNINLGLSSNVANSTLYVANTGVGNAGLDVQSTSILHSGVSGSKGLIVIGAEGQTGDLTQWQNVGGSVLASISSNGLVNATTAGLSTYVSTEVISDSNFVDSPVNGTMAIDSTDGRLYFRNAGVWSYIYKSGGFQIPAEEVSSLSGLTGQPIQIGDFLIPYVEKHMEDGAVHGLYAKWSDVESTLFAGESARILALEEKSSTESGDLNLPNLNVLGISTLGDVDITNQLTINNLQFINGAINSAEPIKLQSLALDSIQLIENSIEVDQYGNLYIKNGAIYGNSQMRGSAVIPAGKNFVTVPQNWKEIPKTILPNSSFGSNVWITDITNEGFTIHSGNVPDKDETIDWVAIW